jgi:hypothetical protein
MAANIVSVKLEIIAPHWLLLTAGVLHVAGNYLPPLKWIGDFIVAHSIRVTA